MDQIDEKIINILQKNSRITMQKLAKELPMSVPATCERVKKLEDSGVITGYTATVDTTKMGKTINAFILCSLRIGELESIIRWARKTPRKYPLAFRRMGTLENHYAIIGMATVVEDYPLYYEAANEHGLAMAGLNFPGNACYYEEKEGADNVSPFEFIPWLLGRCRNLREAREALGRINLCEINFSEEMPLSPLHWIIADRDGAITVETVSGGMKIYENPVGILTNNPPFDYHMLHLADYLNLSACEPGESFGGVVLERYCKGMGAIGLPGDLSSASRFVRAAFTKLHSVSGESEEESIGQFFHNLGAVEQQRGCARLPDGKYEISFYTSCINTDKGIYYYTTYENQCISAVDMHRCDLDGEKLSVFTLTRGQQILWQN